MIVIGADECGWGAIAGPFVVCAVAAPEGWDLSGMRDSKKLSPRQRVAIEDQIRLCRGLEIELGIVDAPQIDHLGPQRAFVNGYKLAIEALLHRHTGARLLLDGKESGAMAHVCAWARGQGAQVEIAPKADDRWPTVKAASIVGKVHHDEEMRELAARYPDYGFDENNGYPTSKHDLVMRGKGICPEHRRSYAPVQSAYTYHRGIIKLPPGWVRRTA